MIQRAWRAFLGWRKSWLSREIIAFGALPAGGSAIVVAWYFGDIHLMRLAVTGTAASAFIAVLCSVMVYVDTRRPFWSLSIVSGKFIGTSLLLGAALCAVTWSWLGLHATTCAMALAVLFRWSLSLWEVSRYRRALEDVASPWHKSARILHKHLRYRIEGRGLLLVATGLLIPVIIAAGASTSWMLTLSLALTFLSQWIERQYFFTAAAGSKMPGN